MIEHPAIMKICNVTASDTKKYILAVEIYSAKRIQSTVDLAVLGKPV